MADMFKVQAGDLLKLRKFYKRAPNKFRSVQANVLNSFAFGTRAEQLDVIQKRMIIRNKRFASGSMRVEKARSGRLESRTGSLMRARFTGWQEQQTGGSDPRGRVATLLGRSGDINKQIRPMARMKPGQDFINPDDYPGKSNEHRTTVMLQAIHRNKERKPFIIKRSRKWKRGLYKLHGRKIKMLQSFEPRSNRIQRIPWATIGKRRYFAVNKPRDVWAASIRRVLK
jgi:hypothetical protein